MNAFKKFVIFAASNFAGFCLPYAFYLLLVLKFKVIDISSEGFNLEGFFYDINAHNPIPFMVFLPTMTWFACAVFSFAYFFVSDKWKKLFLLAPIAMPALHSIVIMLKFV